MYVFLRFLRFFKIQKNMTFYVFLSCCTRFPEQWTKALGGFIFEVCERHCWSPQ